MRRRELERYLKAAGFALKRHGKHAVWSDGRSRITIPHGNRIESRLSRFIRIQIERAIMARGMPGIRTA